MSEIASPGPVDPNSGQPDHGAEVSALKSWFRENMVSLVITAVVVGLVVAYLDPIDTLKVIVGLGLVIFIHELGHFLAAKWCDVHVRTFSIGFGPAVPFCSYKWGETTYMVGIIPLGGYVSMVGEGEAAGDEEAEEDPRSFRKKSVGQRMIIISAGVIMNVILGMACFVAAYMHGVQEKPATVAYIESGGAAWRAGIHTNDDIVRIDGRNNPFFNDIRPIVMSTLKGETVEIAVRHPDGSTDTFQVEPLKDEGVRFPQVGIAPPDSLTLISLKKRKLKPVVPGSPAAAAADPGFEPGDRVVGMTDPDDPAQVTPLRPDPQEPGRGADFNDYHERMVKLAGKPVTLRVVRKDRPAEETVDIIVGPSYRATIGARMRIGEVAALRVGGPAERAGVKARTESPAAPGDRISVLKLPEAGGKETWFAAGDVKPDGPHVAVRKLDPVLLPLEVKKWAARNPAERKVKLVVLRRVEHRENDPVELELYFDPAYGNERETVRNLNSPVPVGGLGLAYWVEAVAAEVEPGSPAAEAGLQPNEMITAVRLKALDYEGKVVDGDWKTIKPHQWASVEAAFQDSPPYKMDVKVKRNNEDMVLTVTGRADTNWPTEDRGLRFQQDFRVQKAKGFGDALSLGAWRAVRFIKEVYMNLYAMIRGRVDAQTMSGPLTIANVSYRFAGEDFWQFLLFIGMISVNLAVVNFLPIPVLDGGHMVFLILEKILGRPVPEKVFAFAMYVGLAMILSLMIFVITLDIRRLFFGWF
jgi:regulator of sigma E protease